MKELKFKNDEIFIIVTNRTGIDRMFKFTDKRELSNDLKEFLEYADRNISGSKLIVYQAREYDDNEIYLCECLTIDFKMIYSPCDITSLYHEIMTWTH